MNFYLPMPTGKILSYTVFILLIFLFFSCRTYLFPRADLTTISTSRVADPGLSHEEYVLRLLADGWPVDSLNTAASADYLDDDEKSIILAHNLVRSNPRKYARLYVAEYITYFQGKEFHYPGLPTIMLTREGAAPAEELFRDLMRSRPLNLLYPSRGLSKAAKSHVQYLCDLGIRGHGGQGGLRARIERHGEWDVRIAENIAYGNFSPHDAVLYLLIDDQVFDRSHRKILLNPGFQYVGVAKDRHPAYPTGYTYVMNYACFFRESTE